MPLWHFMVGRENLSLMRNIFDQYEQPENRLTHALISCLARDRRLLSRFISWSGQGEKRPAAELKLLEQELPGEREAADEVQASKRGLPDACIFDKAGWALLIECKIAASLQRDQLDRHIQTAIQKGFRNIRIVVLVTSRPTMPLPHQSQTIEWRELYIWLLTQSSSEWARNLGEYMEVLEAKLVDAGYLKNGTLTCRATPS